jgi:hypothetical protein
MVGGSDVTRTSTGAQRISQADTFPRFLVLKTLLTWQATRLTVRIQSVSYVIRIALYTRNSKDSARVLCNPHHDVYS